MLRFFNWQEEKFIKKSFRMVINVYLVDNRIASTWSWELTGGVHTSPPWDKGGGVDGGFYAKYSWRMGCMFIITGKGVINEIFIISLLVESTFNIWFKIIPSPTKLLWPNPVRIFCYFETRDMSQICLMSHEMLLYCKRQLLLYILLPFVFH